MVSAGAKILGSFTIGENSKIGAGSVVLEEVPPNCTVVGVPGRIVKQDNVKIPRADMDQIHLPDPILGDLSKLREGNVELCKRIEALENIIAKMKIETCAENGGPCPAEKKAAEEALKNQ